MPKLRKYLTLLETELGRHPWLAGPHFTPADAYLLPLIHYLRKLPESSEMLRNLPALDGSLQRIASRPSAIESEPPRMPSRA